MNPMIEVRSLRKRYGVVDAVNGITFSVARGEVLGFLGPNGAGKSTTMKMITGYLPATSGQVRVCGHDIDREPLESKRHIGYLPEGAPLYGDMTPASMLGFAASVRRLPSEMRRRRIAEVVAALELEPVLLRHIETLSKGFKRRVGLAQAVLHDPDVLILDEPTDGLDPNQKHQVRKLIRSMGNDKAIIISTHLLEEVDAVCDRAIVIDQGRIVLEGTPAELHAHDADHHAVLVVVGEGDLDRASLVLRTLDGVAAVEVRTAADSPKSLFVRPLAGRALAAPVSAALRGAGVEILEMRTEVGKLDAVFRQVTGSSAQRMKQ